MSTTYKNILDLVKKGNILISDHGYDELSEDNIFIKDILLSIDKSKLIEDYPNYAKGPCVLLLHKDIDNNPIHVVWGIPNRQSSPAVIVTAYRPDPIRWSDDFLRKKK